MTTAHTPSKRHRPPWWRILKARLFFAWKVREWPWRVPWTVVYISRKPIPPEDIERARQLSIERGWKDIRP